MRPRPLPIFALLIAVALSACSLPALHVGPQEPLRVGGIFDLAHKLSALDGPAARGAQLAVDEINQSGGLLGRPIEFLLKDSWPTTRRIRASGERLIYTDKVSALIGFSDTNQVLAADPLAQSAGIPLIAVGATSPRMIGFGGGETIALNAFGDNAQAAVAAEFARAQFGPKALVIFENGKETPVLVSRYFRKRFEELGGQVLGSYYYVGSPPRLTPIIRNLKGAMAKPDVVYVAAMPANAPWVIRGLRGAGIRAPIMGTASFDVEEVRKANPLELGQVYFTAHTLTDARFGDEKSRRFIENYKVRFGKEPENGYAALGYDAVMLYAEAVRRSETTEAAKVLGAIEGLVKFDGISGSRTYGPGRRVPFKQVTIARVGTSGPEIVTERMPEKAPIP